VVVHTGLTTALNIRIISLFITALLSRPFAIAVLVFPTLRFTLVVALVCRTFIFTAKRVAINRGAIDTKAAAITRRKLRAIPVTDGIRAAMRTWRPAADVPGLAKLGAGRRTREQYHADSRNSAYRHTREYGSPPARSTQ
jgi:hypothetical protein